MFKQCLLIVVAGLLISGTAAFSAAQDSQSNDQSAPPQEMGRGHRGGFQDPAQRTQELTKQLNLTSDQQTKVQGILQNEHSQMESLRQQSSGSPQDRRSKMMDIHQNSNSQIRALLDSNQQKKWDDIQSKREQWMQGHRGGAPEGGSQPQQ